MKADLVQDFRLKQASIEELEAENRAILPQICHLTLYTLRHTIVLAIFEKFPRSRLFSDMRQISARDRTAHVVHCKKNNSGNFLKLFSISA
jgi:hypothetical protein